MTYLTSDQVHIIFPQQYSIPNGVLTCSLSSDNADVNPAPTCSISNKLLKVTNLLNTDHPGSAQLTLKVQGISNPANNPSLSPFIILVASLNN